MMLYVRPNGSAQCLYGEQINLGELGGLDIRRASHVEPDPTQTGRWYVDLEPVGGPTMHGFATRAAALAAEEQWLNERMRNEHVQAKL
jgi:hypothetical protein